MFFSPLRIEIISLRVQERANLGVFCAFVRFALVWFCLFPFALSVWKGLWLVIVALPGPFAYLFSIYCSLKPSQIRQTNILPLPSLVIVLCSLRFFLPRQCLVFQCTNLKHTLVIKIKFLLLRMHILKLRIVLSKSCYSFNFKVLCNYTMLTMANYQTMLIWC